MPAAITWHACRDLRRVGFEIEDGQVAPTFLSAAKTLTLNFPGPGEMVVDIA